MRHQEPEPPKPEYVVGLDLGQTSDYSALAVLERTRLPDPSRPGYTLGHYACRHLHRWPLRTPYPQIVADVCDLVAREPLPGCLLAVDKTGVGAAVVEMVWAADPKAWLHPVLITGGHQTVVGDDGVHHVPKKELVSVLQVLLQARRLKVADSPYRETLLKEFQEFKVKITAAANETFESWRERDHDDLVLSVALAAWLAEKGPPPLEAPPVMRDNTPHGPAAMEARMAGERGERHAVRRNLYGLGEGGGGGRRLFG